MRTVTHHPRGLTPYVFIKLDRENTYLDLCAIFRGEKGALKFGRMREMTRSLNSNFTTSPGAWRARDL